MIKKIFKPFSKKISPENIEMLQCISDGTKSKNFGPGQVGSFFCCSGLEIFPQNLQFFKFFSLGPKKISSDRVKKYLGQSKG